MNAHYNIAQALLATAITQSEAYARQIFDGVTVRDFPPSFRHDAEIIKAMVDAGTPVDYLSVTEQLNAKHIDEILSALDSNTPTRQSVEQWSKILSDEGKRYQATELIAQALDEIRAHKEIDETCSRLAQALVNLRRNGDRSRMVHIGDAAANLSEKSALWLANPSTAWGVSTGYRALDRAIGGFEETSLYILAARPSMGKTALALGIAERIARRGKPVSIFSLEMSLEQVVMRLACMRGFDSYEVRCGKRKEPVSGQWKAWSKDERAAWYNAVEAVSALPVFVNEKSSITTAEAMVSVTDQVIRQKPELIIFDYINLAGDSGENRNIALGTASKNLKHIAKDTGIPVLCLAQLSRTVEHKNVKKPMLSDLRDSGELEQNADVVMFLYREDYYNRDQLNYKPNGSADVLIEKNRNGAVGVASLHFEERYAAFSDLEGK